jgi:hypothetical protein
VTLDDELEVAAPLEAKIERLRAKVAYAEGAGAPICGWPWDRPYEDGRETMREEMQEENDRLRAALERIAESRPDPHDPAPLTHWAADMQRIARASLAGGAEPTRSQQRRIAAQRGEPQPEFDGGAVPATAALTCDVCEKVYAVGSECEREIGGGETCQGTLRPSHQPGGKDEASSDV